MNGLRAFLSPWALAGLAVWLVVMVIAYNWAIPIYANIGGPGLCGEVANCSQEVTYTVNQPDTAIFAVVVASIATATLAGLAVLVRRVRTRV